jgi:glycosyltransferase involved in cell wall biosynthesis
MAVISATLLRRLAESGIPVVYVVCDDWPRYVEQVDPWTAPFHGGPLRSLAGRAVEAVTGLPADAGDIGGSGTYCFVSEFTRQRVLAARPGGFGRSTVVYSGIAPADFPVLAPPAARAAGWRLLYVGRLDAWKGVDTLLRALPLLPEATLTCLGRGADRERARLRGLASTLGLGDRVTFGARDRHELASEYECADVVVFPSEWPEPFGLVPLEAMACGTPVVATGAGGSGEFLADGENVVLFRPADPAALAAAVRRVHDDAELRARIVAGGLRTAGALDADGLADALEAWHVAAATGFAGGVPPDRALPFRDGDPTVAVGA